MSLAFVILVASSFPAFGQIAVRVGTHRFEPVYEHSRKIPSGPPTRGLVTEGITFNIFYQDVISGTGFGFDDPVDGFDRRARLDDVLIYIDSVLNEVGTLDILVEESIFDGIFLAGAGTLFPIEDGFVDSSTLFRLQSGSKLFLGFEEIFLTVDFSWNWHDDPTNNPGPPGFGPLDLFSVLLHEITHGLGFLSFTESNGESFYSSFFGTSTFTTWDSMLVDGTETNLWTGSPPSLNVPVSTLTSENVFFNGPTAVELFNQGGLNMGLPPVFAPSPYREGSSISHWETGSIIGGAVMEHAINFGVQKREYAPFEIGTLLDLGYCIEGLGECLGNFFIFQPGVALPKAESEVISGVRQIDVNVSLNRSSPTFPELQLYDDIFEHFADAVFEATEGTHRIRTVTISNNGEFASAADIVWGQRGHPSSQIVGGRGVPGGHINMFDIFANGQPGAISPDLDFMADETNRRKAGYILAQRWMYFFLGIDNEFGERASDIPVLKSLMHDPYTPALSLDPQLLNLSVRGDGATPFTDFEHTGATAQHRLHGVSAWATIARTYGDDPKLGREVARKLRPFYEELQPVVPQDPNIPQTDLGTLTGSPFDSVSAPTNLSDRTFIAFGDTFRNETARAGTIAENNAETRFLIDVNPQIFTFPVDSAANELTVEVFFPFESDGLNITLIDAEGTPHAAVSEDVVFVSDIFGALGLMTLTTFEISPPATGLWSLTLSARVGEIEAFFTARMLTDGPLIVLSSDVIFGLPETSTFPGINSNVRWTLLTYPAPMVVVANLNRGLGINRVDVTGTLTRPNGAQSDVTFRDNGVAPDLIANDGSYSAEISYFQNGTHLIRVSADNESLRGALTYNGTSRSPADGGAMGPIAAAPIPDENIGEDFLRVSDIVVIVEGLAPDDHEDFFQGATRVETNNIDEFGRIDIPDDIDFFSFEGGSEDSLIVRISRLGNGISAKLTVFDTDGTTIIGRGGFNSAGYVISLPKSRSKPLLPGLTYFASVEDVSATRFEGTYVFSVGPAVASDSERTGLSTSGGGGGGGGCFIATAAYGTPLAEEIDVLRVLRDHYLLHGAFGTAFVDTYYRLSPPIADTVASNGALRAGVRVLLVPVLIASYLVLETPLVAVMLIAFVAFVALNVRRRAVSRRT